MIVGPTDSILSDCPIFVPLERDCVKPAELVLVQSVCNSFRTVACQPKLSFESEGWCPRLDSNQHTLRHGLLRPACLPIPPPGQLGRKEDDTERALGWQARICAVLLSFYRDIACEVGPSFLHIRQYSVRIVE